MALPLICNIEAWARERCLPCPSPSVPGEELVLRSVIRAELDGIGVSELTLRL